MKIGIVNDSAIAVEALRRTLAQRPGLEVAWVAHDGAQAVSMCGPNPPDLVLMDLVMPVMDGVAATREIMRRTPCPILIVTSDVGHHASLVFDAKGSNDELEARLERETAKALDVATEYMVRDLEEWRGIIAANPFEAEAKDDPAHLLLLALKEAPSKADFEALQAAIPGRERLELMGREIYAVYPDGIGESKLTNALMLRKLKTPLTGRNWNTVLKLAALAAA